MIYIHARTQPIQTDQTQHNSPAECRSLALVDTAPACLFLALKAQAPALGGRMLKDFFEVGLDYTY